MDKDKKRKPKCKICGSHNGVVRKYSLFICRRCFKENAERLGFKKFD